MSAQSPNGSTCKCRLESIDPKTLAFISQNFGSPVYIIDEPGIINRLREFKNAVTRRYRHSIVALSYKTNPLHGLLARLHREGVYAEVVSGDELEIARLLGVPNHEIIFNGPMKTDAELFDVFSTGIYLHCDHADEILRAEHQARLLGKPMKIGIRISFSEESGWNRFGFEVSHNKRSEAHEYVSYITNSQWLNFTGVHVQTGTNIRDVAHFSRVSKRVAEFVESIRQIHGIELEWIDLGGGLAGISPTINEVDLEVHPLPSVEEYAASAITPLDDYLNKLRHPAKLFFEPGRTIFEPFGGILMTVVGQRPSREPNVRGVIVDAGFSALTDIDRFKHPAWADLSNENRYPTRLYGPSCRQRDVVRHTIELPAVKVGDHIVVYGTGAYSIATSHTFIRYRPGVVLWKDNSDFVWLRKPDNLENASRLEVISKDDENGH